MNKETSLGSVDSTDRFNCSRKMTRRFPHHSPARLGRAVALAVAGSLWVAPLLASGGVGEPSPSYSATQALREDASLQAVAFRDRQTGLAVGDRGTILRTDDGGEDWQLTASGVECRIDAVCWVSRERVVAVGGAYDRITGISRGVVLYSDDAGRRWQRAEDAELPRLRRLRQQGDEGPLVASGDWSAVSLADEFESRDGGESWHNRAPVNQPPGAVAAAEYRKWTESTGATAVIRAACRADDSAFWAVGDHGLIVHSSDGGASWQVQRGRNRQTAILMVAGSSARVAWPLIGSEALESRHRVSLLLAGDPSGGERPEENAALDLARQAVVGLGGAAADRLKPADSSAEALRREFTHWMTVHRPAVVVIDGSMSDQSRSVLRQAAIDGGAERIVTYSFGGSGPTVLHRNALMTSSGVFASDFWTDALHWVAPGVQPAESISARRVHDAVGAPAGGDSVASGMSLATGQKLSATAQPASRRRLQVAEARLNLRGRIDRMVASTTSLESFTESLETWIEQTPREDRFRLIWTMLQKCEQVSDPKKQTAVLDVLASRFPNRSPGRWAKLQREAIGHSREWSRLRSLLSREKPLHDQASAEPVPVSPFAVPDSDRGGVVPASAATPLLVPERNPIEIQQTGKKTGGGEEVDLAWEFHPLVLVAREAARRRGDDRSLQATGKISANLQRLIESSSSADWGELLRPDGARMISAQRAEKPPRLDGKIDDPCWPRRAIQLDQSLQLRLAYDDEFLYAAIRCPSEMLATTPNASNRSSLQRRAERSRDHDLSGGDRLQFSLDIDRDLLTAMQLEFSAEGRTHDSIDGHEAWQPTWYIAPRREGQQIQFELAILRRDLVQLPLHRGQSWFISLRPLASGEAWQPSVMPSPSRWLRVTFQ